MKHILCLTKHTINIYGGVKVSSQSHAEATLSPVPTG
jgi:hypothetical protein